MLSRIVPAAESSAPETPNAFAQSAGGVNRANAGAMQVAAGSAFLARQPLRHRQRRRPALRQRGIGRLIVSGIRTEQCCETTTRHASDLGFEVDFVTEATLTFPMTHASGSIFSANDIRIRTELVLSNRFARIATVEQALSPLSAVA